MVIWRLAMMGCLMMCAASAAHAQDTLIPSAYGTIAADFRYRLERVEDDARPETALANTARLRLSYTTPEWNGISGFVEGETIQHIGYTRFNDTLNNRTRYPDIRDPEDHAINQLYVSFKTIPGWALDIGRQSITHDTHRFVGWSRFRQNDVMYDAVRLIYSPVKSWKVEYSYVWNVNRVTGNRSPNGELEGNSHLIHLKHTLNPAFNLSGYAYQLDFDDRIDAVLSSQTVGLRLEWQKPEAEIQPFANVMAAWQTDAGDNPLDYQEPYLWLEGGLRKGDWKMSAIAEWLYGNGTAAVQTPLATLHNYNGWVDKFNTTPRDGLADYQLHLSVPLHPDAQQKLELFSELHYYTSTHGSRTYGHEAGIGLNYMPTKRHAVMIKYSDFNGQDEFTDASKFWLSIAYRL